MMTATAMTTLKDVRSGITTNARHTSHKTYEVIIPKKKARRKEKKSSNTTDTRSSDRRDGRLVSTA